MSTLSSLVVLLPPIIDPNPSPHPPTHLANPTSERIRALLNNLRCFGHGDNRASIALNPSVLSSPSSSTPPPTLSPMLLGPLLPSHIPFCHQPPLLPKPPQLHLHCLPHLQPKPLLPLLPPLCLPQFLTHNNLGPSNLSTSPNNRLQNLTNLMVSAITVNASGSIVVLGAMKKLKSVSNF